MKTNVLDVQFDGLTMDEALERALALMDRKNRGEGGACPIRGDAQPGNRLALPEKS